ncbi:Calpain-B [Madurella mycetomatis]|uniref:Calpain-B n=1 Tax=Madurella mycetomatis TaxID=100816 RepID=A0A175W759_9PEZI|nr:Calpain-B [Madurella mycetomatis]
MSFSEPGPWHVPPQKKIDAFWDSFTTKAPGKVTTILPKNVLAERLAKRSAAKDLAGGRSRTASTSYEEAAALCRAKVDKIVAECRRVNQKYRDTHFDLEYDLRTGRRHCLESLSNIRADNGTSDSDSIIDRPPPGVPPGPPPPPPPPPSSSTNDPPGYRFDPKSVKRVGEIFDDPKFFIDGPTAHDVRQGEDGDCWLMAALCTLSNKPGLIERVCVAHNQDVGVYGFVFHRDGEWISEIIDDKLYLIKPDYDQFYVGSRRNIERALWEDIQRPDSEENYRKTYQSNSGALYFAQCENPNETWLPLLEKAYAKAHGDYAAIEGGATGEGIEDLTGGVSTELFTTDILDKEYFWKEELMKVNKDFLFGCSTGHWGHGYGHRNGILERHAYSVMRVVEMDGERLLLLKNPWGRSEWKGPWSDGSKEWTPEWLQKLGHRFGDDGAFWISYKDLLRKYSTFHRTRLFGPEWKVTSMWTSLNVPWTLEYHDTKFAFTLANSGPVVIVLSQLDDRYFRGLEGEYEFGLGFRIHKAGEEDYLVRAQAAHISSRSCNVELNLEAGDYTVLVKIEAHRCPGRMSPEDVVGRYAESHREKLLRIGLAYDLAHSKARAVETPEEKAERQAYEKRKKAKRLENLRRNIMKDKQARYDRERRAVEQRRKEFLRRGDLERGRAENGDFRQQPTEEHSHPEQGEGSRSLNPTAPEPRPMDKPQEERIDGDGPVREEERASSETVPGPDEEAAPETAATDTNALAEGVQGSFIPSGPANGGQTPTDNASDVDSAYDRSGHIHDGPESHPRGRRPLALPPKQGMPPPGFGEHPSLYSPRSVSPVSDTELNDILDKEDWQAKRMFPPRHHRPPAPGTGRDPKIDPWNAVAVVGLRIYCKVAEGREEDKDAEPLVKLRVVRPKYYELSDDESEDEEERDNDEKEEEEGTDETKVLDVDDSAKDATLESPKMLRRSNGRMSAEGK